ncbi:MAG: bifunctional nicotinamide-nucleotide adenylyltransferase/Nudix hydroxylase [Zoogloeaceae bacterium]|jgi:bifunctional NMN adenylyltransferase/nudix hydrolase|nr:bifunctional nicotinamide-nucleotide adenylyltransferase/Nudix hydroxylase [Zoogloeaceae bacterium]
MSAIPDIAILIGRFQPFHNGHAGLLRQALALAERVLVVPGSAHQARTPKNPFTWEERAAMIVGSLAADQRARVAFLPVRDYYDDRRWAAAVEKGVREHCGEGVKRITLTGFAKDASTYYLNLFPNWAFHAVERQGDIDASRVRQLYFAGDFPDDLTALLPENVARFLQDWSQGADYAALRADWQAIGQYRQRWGNGPFITVDAVVTAAQHVLLIRRGSPPGRGLWAVPGGFLEGRERLLQGARRELQEETGFDAPDTALRAIAVFDHPDRSQRARIITHAHWFDLHLDTLPKVHGADDAAEARWIPLADLPALEAQCFEDHFHLLNHFLGVVE